MATELVFSNGHRVRVIGTNAPTLTLTLARPGNEQIRLPSGETLAPGWVDVDTEDEGVILVNPVSVAYVRDIEAQAVHDLPG